MRALIIGLGVVYVAGSAMAKSIAVGPAECPAAADAPVYEADRSVAALDLNAANGAAETLAPIIDIPVELAGNAAAFVRTDAHEAAVIAARWSADGCP